MKNWTLRTLAFLLVLLMSGCAKYENVKIHGAPELKFNGLTNSTLHLTLVLDVENPNRASFKVKALEFTAYLAGKHFGSICLDHKIRVRGRSREKYEVPLMIKLRTAADTFKLMANRKKLLQQLTVEGYVKGGKFPVMKKIRIEKQTVEELVKSLDVNDLGFNLQP